MSQVEDAHYLKQSEHKYEWNVLQHDLQELLHQHERVNFWYAIADQFSWTSFVYVLCGAMTVWNKDSISFVCSPFTYL